MVVITWKDASSMLARTGLSDEEVAEHGLMKRHTIGYLASENKEAVVLASDFDLNGSTRKFLGNLRAIPRSQIINITKVGTLEVKIGD